MTDLAQDVLELAERSIRHSGAGSEGFRVSVNWLPQVTPLGASIAWIILITLPSHMIGQPAIGVTCSPIMSPSVPREHEVSAAIAEALPKLREARDEQDRQAIDDAAAALGNHHR